MAGVAATERATLLHPSARGSLHEGMPTAQERTQRPLHLRQLPGSRAGVTSFRRRRGGDKDTIPAEKRQPAIRHASLQKAVTLERKPPD